MPNSHNTALSRVFSAFKSAFRFSGDGGLSSSQSASGRGMWPMLFLPGSQLDYIKEAGDPWTNSIVLACVKWLGNTLPEAPLQVVEKQGDNTDKVIVDHALPALLARPNKYYSGALLWMATLLSWTVAGNAYWIKVRNVLGDVIEIWYVPHFQITPAWPRDGSEYISHYEFRPDSQRLIKLPVEDVVHFRDGIDPSNYRMGLSRIGAALREIVTDNEAATFSAAMLRNAGVPSVIFSPKADAQGGFPQITETVADDIKRQWRTKYGGDRRGEAAVMSQPFEITAPSFTPEQMVLDKVRSIPEERICALLGIPPIVVGMGAGLDRSTFANYKEAREAAYESCLIPLHRNLTGELDVQLLSEPQFGGDKSDRLHTIFDLTKVRALQDDRMKLYAALTQAVGGPWITPNQARIIANMSEIPGADNLYPPPRVAPGVASDDEPDPSAPSTAKPASGKEPKKP